MKKLSLTWDLFCGSFSENLFTASSNFHPSLLRSSVLSTLLYSLSLFLLLALRLSLSSSALPPLCYLHSFLHSLSFIATVYSRLLCPLSFSTLYAVPPACHYTLALPLCLFSSFSSPFFSLLYSFSQILENLASPICETLSHLTEFSSGCFPSSSINLIYFSPLKSSHSLKLPFKSTQVNKATGESAKKIVKIFHFRFRNFNKMNEPVCMLHCVQLLKNDEKKKMKYTERYIEQRG